MKLIHFFFHIQSNVLLLEDMKYIHFVFENSFFSIECFRDLVTIFMIIVAHFRDTKQLRYKEIRFKRENEMHLFFSSYTQ